MRPLSAHAVPIAAFFMFALSACPDPGPETFPCDDAPCAHGGTCVAIGETFTCECASGWSGATCETSDGCAGAPCGAGTCLDDGQGGYTCDCPEGSFDDGAACAACNSLEGCTTVTCTSADDAVCTDCQDGFAIEDGRCRDIDDCAGAPCGTGSCVDTGVGAYACECEPGEYDDGVTCAACTPIEGCDAWICEGASDSECTTCSLGYRDNGLGGCQPDGGCLEEPCGQGECIETDGNYRCECPAGQYDDGTTCATCAAIADCDEVACTSADDVRCERCASGFVVDGGGACADVDDCSPDPCPVGARCVDLGANAFECDPLDSVDATTGGTATVETEVGAITVSAPSEAFVDAEGTLVTGEVRVSVEAEGFSGDHVTSAGTAFWPEVMVDVTLADALGNPVSVAPGETLTLTLPLPPDVTHALGSALLVYYYEEATSRWSVESTGTVVAHAGGLGVRAAVGHFTWYAAGHTCQAMAACDRLDCETGRCAECATGFAVTPSGTCANVDDCVGHLCGSGSCIDAVAGYTCDCPDGTWGDGTTACTACTPSGLAGCTAERCTGPTQTTCAACASGYTLSGGACADVDDCKSKPCGAGTCTDTGASSWSCDCPDGTFGDGSRSCTACSATTVTGCTAVTCTGAGASTCVGCAAGYQLQNGACRNLDECTHHRCGTGTCLDGVNGYTCDCPDGTFGDGSTSCTACGPSSSPGCTAVTCTRAGASTCVACAPGYSLASGACTNIDDCAANPCGDGICIDGVGGWTCDCPDGSFGDGTTSCSPCTPSAAPGCTAVTCISAGASTCVACGAGYTLSGSSCVDANDCAPNPCGAGTCTDTGVSSFTCDCPDGSYGDGTTSCTSCAPIAGCTALTCTGPGASACTACGAGYTLSAGACQNVDDCPGHTCGSGTCVDGVSDYTCNCPDGMYGDGTRSCVACDVIMNCTAVTCTSAANETCATCATGYEPNGSGGCKDIDDCASSPCNGGKCTDTGVSSYDCADCPSGKYDNGTTCANCDAIANCTAVTCTSASDETCATCATGFEANGTGGCKDIDYCNPNPCNGGTCTDTGVNSYDCSACPTGTYDNDTTCASCDAITNCTAVTCTSAANETCATCATGYEPNGTGGCRDIDDCASSPCNGGTCNDTGANSYDCSDCPSGKYDSGTTCASCEAIAECDAVTCTSTSDETCVTCAAGFEANGTGGCKDIDDCNPNPCNGGTCTDTGVNSYDCSSCPVGKYDSGITCVACEPVADCAEVSCSSGTDSACEVCADGFVSDGQGGCQDADDCAPSPCQNGGVCTDTGTNTFSCACLPGYQGFDCASVVSGCDSDFACPASTPACIAGTCATVDACSGDDDREHDDDGPHGATPLAAAPSSSDGRICGAAGEADWFELTFDGTEAERSLMLAWDDPDFDLDLELFDATGSIVSSGVTSNAPEEVTVLAPSSGTYYARVVAVGGGAAAVGYTLTLAVCGRGSYAEGGGCTSCPLIAGCSLAVCSGAGDSTCATCDTGHDPDGSGGCVEHDDCVPDPCENGGVCSDGIDGYTCACPIGYTGLRCETAIEACDSGFDCPAESAACVAGSCDVVELCASDDADDDGDDGPNGAPLIGLGQHPGQICRAADEADWHELALDGVAERVLVLTWTEASFDLDLTVYEDDGELVDSSWDASPESVTLSGLTAGVYFAVVTAYAGPDGASAEYMLSLRECPLGSFSSAGGCQPCEEIADCSVVSCDAAQASTCLRCDSGFDPDGAGGCLDHDDCVPNPCENGGICDDAGLDAYTCTCPSGTGGDRCEVVATACSVDFDCPAANPACLGDTCGIVDGCTGDDVREHADDGPAGATPITTPFGPVQARICDEPSGRESDWYEVALEAGAEVTITVAWDELGVDLDFVVLDAGGRSVGSATSVNEPEVLVIGNVPTTGRYYIAVYSYDGAPDDAIDYELTLEIASGACQPNPCNGGICSETGPGTWSCSDCPTGKYDNGTTCTTCDAITNCTAVTCTSAADETCVTCAAGYEPTGNGGCQLLPGLCPPGTLDVYGDQSECLTIDAIAAGSTHTCAIASNGALYCWGANDDGQLGDGTNVNRANPVRVDAGAGWVAISAGTAHTCGITEDGTLYCWGYNWDGQVGDGTESSRLTPAQIGQGGWTEVSAGYSHTCARRDGEVYCWGNNVTGQLGDDTTSSRATPWRVGASADWSEVAAGHLFTCGRRGGSLYCWGANWNGNLGDGTRSEHWTPTRVGEESDWLDVAVGSAHACGRRGAGVLYCWGYGGSGQLGNGTTADSTIPLEVAGESGWAEVAVGDDYSCGRRGGELYCWGGNRQGQRGDGTTNQSTLPVQVGSDIAWSGLTAGHAHTCGLRGGAAFCWGWNDAGQLGDGAHTLRGSPTQVGSDADWTEIASGSEHTCALKGDSLYCWGANWHGQLGDGNVGVRSDPVQVGDETPWSDFDVGSQHSCGLRAGAAYCWGDNSTGQLGDGTTIASPSPVQVGSETGWTEIATGGDHTCGVLNGAVQCWGNMYDTTPVQIHAEVGWSQLTGGSNYTCGMLDGTLHCWGVNWDGRLGDGTTTHRAVPTPIDTGHWSHVNAGSAHTCGGRDGALYCWGGNWSGQLGNGSTTSSATPTRVGAATDWTAIAVGNAHSCGIRAGRLFCWGYGRGGALGDGGYETRHSPIRVGVASDWSHIAAGGDTCGIRGGELFCWGRHGHLGVGEIDTWSPQPVVFCPAGLAGPTCATPAEVDACTDNPCVAGGVCVDSPGMANTAGGRTCECPEHLAYDDLSGCDGIDECDSHGCATGVCIDGVDTYTCDCSDGSFGDGTTSCTDCGEIADCDWVVCTHATNETCASCAVGYEPNGSGACTVIDDCAGDPCNGGTCTDTGVSSYDCSACPAGTFDDGATCAPCACDDGDACTVDVCDVRVGCRHQLVPDGSSCQSEVVGWGDYFETVTPNGAAGVVAIFAGRLDSWAAHGHGKISHWTVSAYKQELPDLSGVVAVASGDHHELFLHEAGTVSGWGSDHFGQASVPVPLTLPGAGVVAVAAGWYHSLALLSDGSVVGWGRDDLHSATPPLELTYQPGEPPPDVVAITAGGLHNLALKGGGRVVGWGGNNVYGEASPPEELTDGTWTALGIAAGDYHSLALISGGSVVGWGADFDEQATPPVGLGGVVAVATGERHSLALKSDGTVVAWGDDEYGQRSVPAGLSDVIAIASKGRCSLALKRNGVISAWGQCSYDQDPRPRPDLSNVVSLKAGFAHYLALNADRTVSAWGYDGCGSARVPPDLADVVAIAAGSFHSLALRQDGSVVAWGAQDEPRCSGLARGQAIVPATLPEVKAIAAGSMFSLALTVNGTVVAWGAGGSFYDDSVDYGETDVPPGLDDVIAIFAGEGIAAAQRSDGTIVAWGEHAGDLSTVMSPVDLGIGYQYAIVLAEGGALTRHGSYQVSLDGGGGIVALAAGRYQVVALKGDGTISESFPSSAPSLTNVTAIAAGERSGLALVRARAPTISALQWWQAGSRWVRVTGMNLERVRAVRIGGHITRWITDTSTNMYLLWGPELSGDVEIETGGGSVTVDIPVADP